MDETERHDALFAALCNELGLCLHDKGQKRVIAALPEGLDAAVKVALEADGVDFLNAPGSLKRAVRDCMRENLARTLG